jgi:hypothetical protein
MPYLLVRHKVQDYTRWRPHFDGDAGVRHGAGLHDEIVLRNADDPNEVTILFQADDLEKARQFTSAPQLREVMEKAGVVDRPTISFLDSAG